MTRSTRQRERTRETDETEEQEGNVPAPSVNRTISSRTPTGESSSAKTVGLVVEEEQIDPGPEWRAFNHPNGKKSPASARRRPRRCTTRG